MLVSTDGGGPEGGGLTPAEVRILPLRPYILGRGLSPSEKEDPEHYPNDHQNHQKGQQEECEHSQHGEETSTKGPATLDLQ